MRPSLPADVDANALVEWTSDAIFAIDTDGRVTLWNRAAEWLFGHAAHEVVGQSVLSVYTTAGAAQARRVLADVLDGARVAGLHIEGRHRDGRTLHLEATYAPLLDSDRNVIGAVVTARDASETWRRERELADLLDNAALGVHQAGPDGTILYANRALLAMLGYNAQEYIGHNVREFYNPPEVADQFLETLGAGARLIDEPATMRHKDGSIRHVRIDSSALILNGRFVHSRCFIRDVTEQRHIEAERAHLAAIVAFASEAIILRDLDGTIRTWNHGAEAMFGHHAHEMVGRDISRLLTPEDDDERRQWQPLLEAGLPVENLAHAVHRDGHIVEVSVRSFPVRDAEGRLIGVSKIMRDVSERNRQIKELESLRNQLEHRVEERTRQTQAALRRMQRANEELREFAEVATHDLRGPMRKVVQFGDLLQEELKELDHPGALHHLDRMVGAAKRMANLLDDLRDYVAVGERTGVTVPVSLHKITHEVLRELEAQARDGGARVEVGELPVVDADPVQMRHLLQNLLSNALKFRRPGVPPVVRVLGRLETPDLAQIEVVDNGIGFQTADAERIFRPFTRLQPVTDGTGIGLAIARRIVDRHGGSIHAEGRSGEGARFVIRLPVKPRSLPSPPADEA